jgi:hypothetical protein
MVYRDLKVYKPSLNPASVTTYTGGEQTFTVTGLDASRDLVLSVTKPTTDASLVIGGFRISADDTLAINFLALGSTVNAGAETYTVVVGRAGSDPYVTGDKL